MYKGTKFNTTKEDVAGETYLGIQIFRFYWRCSTCAAEITMKTDPENTDYTVEHGATRNYEPWREKDASKNQLAAERWGTLPAWMAASKALGAWPTAAVGCSHVEWGPNQVASHWRHVEAAPGAQHHWEY